MKLYLSLVKINVMSLVKLNLWSFCIFKGPKILKLKNNSCTRVTRLAILYFRINRGVLKKTLMYGFICVLRRANVQNVTSIQYCKREIG